MTTVTIIRKIANGFIIQDFSVGCLKEHYIENFDVQKLIEAMKVPDHELELRGLVLSFPEGSGKIPPIKAVRDYCFKNKFDKYYGLRDAKDFVESLRSDEYWRGYSLT